MRDDWRRYAGPAAFLLAATIAIVLVRNGIEAGDNAASTTRAQTVTRKTVDVTTTTTKKTTTTTKTTTSKATGRRFWTVEAGDSFGVISSKTGVPVETLEELNPGVSSTSLVIGQKIRIS